MAVLSDGALITCGHRTVNGVDEIVVGKYTPNGVLDQGFGSGGLAFMLIDEAAGAEAVVIREDGMIFVAGWSELPSPFARFTIASFLPDGSVNAAFGSNGSVATPIQSSTSSSFANDIVLQPDGRIVVAGSGYGGSVMCVVRYDATGALDPLFGNSGILQLSLGMAVNTFTSLALQPDGKILAGGSSAPQRFQLIRLDTTGTLDTSFGSGGIVSTPQMSGTPCGALDMTLLDDGHILLAGNIDWDMGVAKYHPDGSPDPSFGVNGVSRVEVAPSNDDMAHGMCVQPDGKILLAGGTNSFNGAYFGLMRLNADGVLDTQFGNAGSAVLYDWGPGTSRAYAVALQPNGRIVAVGDSSATNGAVVGLLNDDMQMGQPQLSAADLDIHCYPDPTEGTVNVQYSLLTAERLSMFITDLLGRTMQMILVNEARNKGAHCETLDLSGLAAGCYTIILTTAEGRTSVKVMKE